MTLTSSALLYADHVNLYSMTAAFLRQFGALSGFPPEFTVKLLVDAILESEYTPPKQREQLIPVSTALGQFITYWETTSRKQRHESGSNYRKLKKQLQPVVDRLRFQYFDMWRDYGGDQLVEAENAGHLTIMTSWIDELLEDGELDQERTVSLLESQIASTQGSLMFDSMMGGLVSAAQKEELIQVPVASRYGIRRTTTGTAMIAYLPTFSGASISDVLEAKSQIRTPLDDYREAVKDLEQRISSNVQDPKEFKEELDFLWHDRVEKRIQELSKAFQDTNLPRVSAASKRFAGGVIVPGMVFLVGDKVTNEGKLTSEDMETIINAAAGFGVDAWLTPEGAVTASVAGGVIGAVNGWRNATKKLASPRVDGLFYLVETNKALKKRK